MHHFQIAKESALKLKNCVKSVYKSYACWIKYKIIILKQLTCYWYYQLTHQLKRLGKFDFPCVLSLLSIFKKRRVVKRKTTTGNICLLGVNLRNKIKSPPFHWCKKQKQLHFINLPLHKNCLFLLCSLPMKHFLSNAFIVWHQ